MNIFFSPAEFTMSSLACSGLLPAPQHRSQQLIRGKKKKKLDGFSASGMHKFQCGVMLVGLTKPPKQLLSKALFYVPAVHFPRVSGMPFFITAAINQFSSPCYRCHFTSLFSCWFPPPQTHSSSKQTSTSFFSRNRDSLTSCLAYTLSNTHINYHIFIKKSTPASTAMSNIKLLIWNELT